MKKSKLSEAQIFELLKEGASGKSTDELCRNYGISQSTYYRLRDKYGGMSRSDLKRLKALEEENKRLKRMYSELCLDNNVLKEIVEKKLQDR